MEHYPQHTSVCVSFSRYVYIINYVYICKEIVYFVDGYTRNYSSESSLENEYGNKELDLSALHLLGIFVVSRHYFVIINKIVH